MGLSPSKESMASVNMDSTHLRIASVIGDPRRIRPKFFGLQ